MKCISLVSAFQSWNYLSGAFQWDQFQNCYRREKDLGVSLRRSLQQKTSQRAQVAHLHKESKRFSILLLKDSELHTSWKRSKTRKPNPCWRKGHTICCSAPLAEHWFPGNRVFNLSWFLNSYTSSTGSTDSLYSGFKRNEKQCVSLSSIKSSPLTSSLKTQS